MPPIMNITREERVWANNEWMRRHMLESPVLYPLTDFLKAMRQFEVEDVAGRVSELSFGEACEVQIERLVGERRGL